ncbi:MAG TPA: enoyl-CoA hydratase/isomerase family protein [Candidatus Limnocylindrales bacterium]|nr:enoyl-CoA hydratase/isomerase family protein [Candidatus Limnocylindrales bacterium]
MPGDSSPHPHASSITSASSASYQETSIAASIHTGVLLLQLTAADNFPRLTQSALKQIRYQFAGFISSPDLTAAVITGTEKCFAAGAELMEVSALTAVEALRFAALGQSVMRMIENCPKPIVAAIRGYCMGGGFDLALACHARIATPDAIFAHRGASLGIITGWGGTQRLPRILGPNGHTITMELMTTGRTVDAKEALSLGLISRLVPGELILEAAIEYAAKAASKFSVRPV